MSNSTPPIVERRAEAKSAMTSDTQDLRDRIIRLETEHRHIVTDVDNTKAEIKDLVETSRNQAIAVAGLVEALRDIKETTQKVNKHDSRIQALEAAAAVSTLVDSRLKELEQKADRAMFLIKVVGTVVTTPVFLGIAYLGISFVHNMPK